ncbi:prolyl oligopeptidase family protein [Entamoeba histolytica]|uniref:Prolyl oligopeptidase family protein n=7 Tax=Entamoeba histolytica TaxID=5759 RepID=C4LSC6_ENTH1|nr:prolyl oligopeptidase family protein [Entamoeba histolytica HM-1:IMSS]EAL50997.2 prolyl oligopeptidase family protein [Entamoeba histolytica HM-1:IMSS]EMD45289.1 dipeptidylpeptidase precursor, putative [Entamoeba histolytica KU27]GAT91591.1 prolyl oligopeptidase family protein [Entamoeba histolytica]|eukprot:XP_656380.2 prolyl oligopeptidase family protein [Entamoeba histolytica HM-1:IMSS]
MTNISKSNLIIKNRKFTAEALWSMGRINGYDLFDNKLLYTVSYYDIPKNGSSSHIIIKTLNSKEYTDLTSKMRDSNDQLTKNCAQSQTNAIFDKNGRGILFNSNGKLFEYYFDSEQVEQLSTGSLDISEFKISPDYSKCLFISSVEHSYKNEDYNDLPLTSGMIFEDLNYRHWDEFNTSLPHPFVSKLNNMKFEDHPFDILENEPYESPLKPFGGIEQLCWSKDSKKIAYTCKKKVGKEYATSTDSDIYVYDTETKTTINLCKDFEPKNYGFDSNPMYSPSGKKIAWVSMERDGYESDRSRLIIFDLGTKKKSFVSEWFESNVESFDWINDCQMVFTGVWHGLTHIYLIEINNDNELVNHEQITTGQYDYKSVKWFGNMLIVKRQSMIEADELYELDLKTKEIKQISFENDFIYTQIDKASVQPKWMKTVDNKDMLVWVIYPPHFDSTKKYPTLLYCQGGPQSAVSQFWSYRWNFLLMASEGYIIIAPNRRGLPGFGMEWLEEISLDYGGLCMKDLLTSVDIMKEESYVDSDRLGCVGASFGGYSVYWLAGHHQKRFKVFIAHDGIFNTEEQYIETEEMWFSQWDMGSAVWEGKEKSKKTYENSPHRFVEEWDTPILCIHSEKDYRVVVSQGIAAFNAARMKGVAAELLYFPDENHWVVKAQNGMLWQRTFFRWLRRWLE